MTWPVIITVILIGLILIVLEIVVLPGILCGVLGAGLVGVGVWQSYVQYGVTAGTITLLCSVVVGVVMIAWLMRSKTWNRLSLKEESDSKVNQVDSSNIVVGCKGRCISRLAPAGKAEINGETVEVHSTGAFIDEGSEIEVVGIDGYRIMVKKI